VLADLDWADAETISRFETEMNHDKRAALVCLLTAGFAHAGRAMVVGDRFTGWFWLPHLGRWADWAQQGLQQAIARTRARRFPEACVWTSMTAQ
jgi:predicted RNase H-like nuclease